MKVGCQASIKIRKEFDDKKIIVIYDKEHTGYRVNSADEWIKQRLPPILKTWLQEVVASGADWTAVKTLVLQKQRGEKIMEKLGLEGADSRSTLENEPVQLPHMLYLTYHDYFNARLKHIKSVAQLHPIVLKAFRNTNILLRRRVA